MIDGNDERQFSLFLLQVLFGGQVCRRSGGGVHRGQQARQPGQGGGAARPAPSTPEVNFDLGALPRPLLHPHR